MSLTPASFEAFADAYLAVLRRTVEHSEYESHGRGNRALEVTNVSFRLTDPTRRTVFSAARRPNIVFNWAEVLWYLAGRDDLAMIGYYAPRLRGLSEDGVRLTGTAYGPRLFGPGADGRSQFDRVIELLRRDPDSKRAAMPIMGPEELVDPANPDVACTLGLQFLLRGGRLHATAYLRGNDAVIGLLCDTFSFTVIQELTARRLGVPLGTYTHHVGSMHINVHDDATTRAILAEADAGPAPAYPAVAMPDTSAAELELLLHYEERLRTGTLELTAQDVGALPLPPYWRQVLLLFEAYRRIQHNSDPIGAELTEALTPAHRWLLAARWPDRLPPAAGSGRRRRPGPDGRPPAASVEGAPLDGAPA